jgi:hypothetical protein
MVSASLERKVLLKAQELRVQVGRHDSVDLSDNGGEDRIVVLIQACKYV